LSCGPALRFAYQGWEFLSCTTRAYHELSHSESHCAWSTEGTYEPRHHQDLGLGEETLPKLREGLGGRIDRGVLCAVDFAPALAARMLLDRYGDVPPYRETQGFLRRILGEFCGVR